MSSSARQAAIDARVQAFYGNEFDESSRLTTRSPQGPLERARTLEIVRSHFAGGLVLDIGGGTGLYARALIDSGDSVKLIDPVARHVEQALQAGISAQVGDARALPFDDDAFDAALVLGPLYHLESRDDRLLALREAARVTRAGGLVFVGAISRFVAFGVDYLGVAGAPGLSADQSALLADGTPPPGLRFPAGHFHTAEELQLELEDGGLEVREVVGVEGPAGLLLESLADAPQELIDAAFLLARAAPGIPGIRDFSAHLLAVGVVPGT